MGEPDGTEGTIGQDPEDSGSPRMKELTPEQQEQQHEIEHELQMRKHRHQRRACCCCLLLLAPLFLLGLGVSVGPRRLRRFFSHY